MLKKGQKNEIKYFSFCFKQISKSDTCFYLHFLRAFQKYRSVALVTKKLWAILDFFSLTGLFPAL